MTRGKRHWLEGGLLVAAVVLAVVLTDISGSYWYGLGVGGGIALVYAIIRVVYVDENAYPASSQS